MKGLIMNDYIAPRKEGFIISADIISAEVQDYMHRYNLSMTAPHIDKAMLLKLRVLDAIGRRIDMDLKYEDEDFWFSKVSIHNKLWDMFPDSLDRYSEDEIVFDNISELVDAMFKGNWGIEVTVDQSQAFPDCWRGRTVAFIKHDPNGEE